MLQETKWKRNKQKLVNKLARTEAKIIQAKEGLIVFESAIGKEFRIQIPKNVRHNIATNGKVRITIEKI